MKCPKDLTNGACGDIKDDWCDTLQADCVWVNVFQTLEKKNKLENLRSFKLPRPKGERKEESPGEAWRLAEEAELHPFLYTEVED